MKHDAQINIGQNYRFIRATDEQIAALIQRDHLAFDAREIVESLRAGTWAVREWMGLVKRGFLPEGAKVDEYHNIVPTAIRSSLATLISGTSVAPTFKANYLALGTGTTAPANTDTQLQTETLRGAFTNRSAIANVAYLDMFFSTSQVAGQSFFEAGIFCDASGTVNSGNLMSHVAISIVVAANENLTVNSSITVS